MSKWWYSYQIRLIYNNLAPTKIIKLNKDIFEKFISNNFNHCIDEGDFHMNWKHDDAIPVHKRKDKGFKENYLPVGVLTNISEVYFDSILSRSQCGFRKGNSAQQCLLLMIEKFKEAIDREHEFGALLTELS